MKCVAVMLTEPHKNYSFSADGYFQEAVVVLLLPFLSI